MTPFRWKIMGGFLALSVGGLAACADPSADPMKKPAANGGPPPAASPQTTMPSPAVPADPFDIPRAANPPAPIKPPTPAVVEYQIPLQPAPNALPVPMTRAETTAVPDNSTLLIGGLKVDAESPPAPRPGQDELKPIQVPAAPATPAAPPMGIAPTAPATPPAEPLPPLTNPTPNAPAPLPPINPAPTAPMVASPPTNPAPITLPPPPAASPSDPAPRPAEVAPRAVTPQPVQQAVVRADKLRMLVRLGSGTPRFEIRNPSGEELLLKVQGEKIEMKSSPEQAKGSQLAGVSALGKVKFTGPGLEGTCDQLSILSGTGEVLLQGNIHLRTKSGKSWNEISADKMIYQIGANGVITGPGSIRPAAWSQ